MEKVIFREEKDGGFLAVFPEDYAKPSGYGAIAFKLNDNGESFGAWFEPYMEVNAEYMYSCKIIHKTDSRISRLVKELETFYNVKVVDFVRLERARTPNHFLVTFSERKGDYELINAEDIFDIRKG